MRQLFSVVLLIALCQTVYGKEGDTRVVIGLGGDSCASYVLALSANSPTATMKLKDETYFTMANAYTQWITGYVTAANMFGVPGLGQIQAGNSSIARWIKDYCDANPAKPIFAGAQAFVRTHQPKDLP